jgi:hypothetical protein
MQTEKRASRNWDAPFFIYELVMPVAQLPR